MNKQLLTGECVPGVWPGCPADAVVSYKTCASVFSAGGPAHYLQ